MNHSELPPYFERADKVQEYLHICEGYESNFLVDVLVDHLPDASTMSVLELGSGPGTEGRYLTSKFKTVHLSDSSSLFVKHINSTQTLEHPAIVLDAATVPVSPASVDVIFSNKVLQHLPKHSLRGSFQAQHKAIKEGGYCMHSLWLGSELLVTEGLLHQYYTRESFGSAVIGLFSVQDFVVYTEMEDNDSFYVILKKI